MTKTENPPSLPIDHLTLRGAGELLGTRQSGLPQFRLADLAAHADLMAIARDDAPMVAAAAQQRTASIVYVD